MRILCIIASVDPAGGGPIESIVSTGAVLAGSGHLCEVASLDSGEDPWLATFPLIVHPLGITSEEERRRRKWLPWVRYRVSNRFVSWLRQNASRYDAVVIHGLWNFTTLGVAVAVVGRNIPIVVFAHGMLDPWFRRTYPLRHLGKMLFWLLADGRLVNKSSAVLFTSSEEKSHARGAFWPYRPRQEIVVRYGATDVPDRAREQKAAFHAAVPHLGQRRYVLFLSRIHRKKGCDLLVSAFAAVARDHPDVDLVIAGPDPDGLGSTLRATAELAGIAARIHWPGMLQGDAKWGAFRGALAFVLPSHQENFGIVVAEAMACGTPVLITNKVNIWREVLASGGGLVAPDTATGIRHLLLDFLALNADHQAVMGRQARASYEKRFTSSGAAADLERVLMSMSLPTEQEAIY